MSGCMVIATQFYLLLTSLGHRRLTELAIVVDRVDGASEQEAGGYNKARKSPESSSAAGHRWRGRHIIILVSIVNA